VRGAVVVLLRVCRLLVIDSTEGCMVKSWGSEGIKEGGGGLGSGLGASGAFLLWI
jgi:hypothetical protein